MQPATVLDSKISGRVVLYRRIEGERVTRLELATSSLARRCSTTELHPQLARVGIMATLFPGARSNSRSQMYLWHKYASAQWLDIHETTLQEKTSGGLAVIQSANRKLVCLEAYSASKAGARLLREQFGGRIKKLPRNWRHHLFEEPQTLPLRIGNRIEIRNSRAHNPKRTRHVRQLIIPAAGAFGTGAHATTAMCLRRLERISRHWPDGWNMLDAGTGSGILAIGARVLGAKT